MSETIFSRTQMLIGREQLERLKQSSVAVFGIGGVGGFAAEALVRSGIGRLDLIDHDVISPSNLNRQIIALTSTIGRKKTEVMKERALDIRPEMTVNTFDCFFLPENANTFDFSVYDYVIDAVDTVTAKVAIVLKAKEAGVPVISAMGAGNKRNPAEFTAADIYETHICPLAKVMRRELRKRNVEHLKVVYSPEMPGLREETASEEDRKCTPGSIAFVPSAAGLILAGEVVNDLCKGEVKS